MRQGVQRLLEAGGRFPVGRPPVRLGPGLTEVADGLLPQLTPGRVVTQLFHVLRQTTSMECLYRLDDPGVEGAPAVLE